MKTPSWFLRKNLAACLLLPFSVIYYMIGRLVYFFRRINQKSSKRPVICIGNIFAGGVGKTPIVMQIARRLNAPVVMRGYGAKKAHRTGWRGDEAEMLAAAGLNVYVGNRADNVKKLNFVPLPRRAAGATGRPSSVIPIVMDDGFQNPTVKKDISILVFDQSLGVGNGFMLPAGPLREPMCAAKRADAVIIMRGDGPAPDIPRGIPVFYADNKNVMPKTDKPIIAFAGIGYPRKFFNRLRGDVIMTRGFPDHHEYTRQDIGELFALAVAGNADLVTTEKDWVRLPRYAQNKIKAATLETIIEPSFWKWLEDRLK